MDYGVVGDGLADDSEAIRRLFSSLTAVDVVESPKGEYLVSPTSISSYILELPDVPDITIRGIARNSTVIKVAENSGNYLGIFGKRNGSKLSRITIERLTIDHNQERNILKKGYVRISQSGLTSLRQSV